MKRIFISMLISVLTFHSSVSFSCFQPPKGAKPIFQENRREAFLFHDGEYAHLVLQTSFGANKFPREIAWVLPFPSVPTKYEQVDGPFFESLSRAFPSTDIKGFGAGGLGASEGRKTTVPKDIKIHEAVSFDQYEIHPIEILNPNSSQELNNWLRKNGFQPVSKQLQKPYLKKGSAFLAIRMKMSRPDFSTIKSKPLHVVYKSDRLSFPLRFTNEENAFDLNLFVFSKNEMKQDLSPSHLYSRASVPYKNEGLYPFIDALLGSHRGYIQKYSGTGLNSKNQKLNDLNEDPQFTKEVL